MGRCALIIVDMQNDFAEGGKLPVSGGKQVASDTARFLELHEHDYDDVVLTQDWHSPEHVDHDGFPAHCAAGTSGADLIPEARLTRFRPAEGGVTPLPAREEPRFPTFRKGQRSGAFSGFEGELGGQTLGSYLRVRDVTEVDIIGLAFDYCVAATAVSARLEVNPATNELQFDVVRVLSSLTAPVAQDTAERKYEELEALGVLQMHSADAFGLPTVSS